MLLEQKQCYERLLALNADRPPNSRMPHEFVGAVCHYLPPTDPQPAGSEGPRTTWDSVEIFHNTRQAEPGQRLEPVRTVLCETSWSTDGVPETCQQLQADATALELQSVGLQLCAVPHAFSAAFSVSACNDASCSVYVNGTSAAGTSLGIQAIVKRSRKRRALVHAQKLAVLLRHEEVPCAAAQLTLPNPELHYTSEEPAPADLDIIFNGSSLADDPDTWEFPPCSNDDDDSWGSDDGHDDDDDSPRASRRSGTCKQTI